MTIADYKAGAAVHDLASRDMTRQRHTSRPDISRCASYDEPAGDSAVMAIASSANTCQHDRAAWTVSVCARQRERARERHSTCPRGGMAVAAGNRACERHRACGRTTVFVCRRPGIASGASESDCPAD